MPCLFDSEGRTRVSFEPRKAGAAVVFVTHNWADPTTWFTQSERVSAETLVDSGDGLKFTSAHLNWIDLTHGKFYREDLISAQYKPAIRVDGVLKLPRDPWAASGGDYEIDYAKGEVVFFASQAGKTIAADYSYANGSLFVIAPSEGKRLWVEYSEVQFSEDVDIKASIYFQPWAYNPSNMPNKIAAAQPTTYKTLDNYIEEANGVYPPIPAMGGTRGFDQARHTFPFRYATIKELRYDQGTEIRVWTENDAPYGGSYATATFYATSFAEE